MNLREEIQQTVELAENPSNTKAVIIDQLAHLFKRWALEMAGEDEEDFARPDSAPAARAHQLELDRNSLRQEIRQRIEESTKRGGE